MRRPLVGAAVCALTWLCLLVTAGPAAAHAELQGSDPVAGERLEQAPVELGLDFTGGVTLIQDGIRLLDRDGRPQPLGTPSVSGATVTIPVRGLREGAYVLVWRVVSADSHPVQGAVPFAVGDAEPPAVEGLAGTSDGGGVAGLLAVIRWVGYAGTALLIGSVTLVIACWPAGRCRHGLRRALLVGGSLTAAAAPAGLLAQGAYAAGRPLSDLLDPELIAATLGTAYGRAGIARLIAVAAFTAWALRVLRRTSHAKGGAAEAAELVVGAGLAGIVAATFSVQGHAWAASPRLFAVVVDAVHMLAMSVWLGGLTVLAVVALRPTTRTLTAPAMSTVAQPMPAGAAVGQPQAGTVATAEPAERNPDADADVGSDSDRGGLNLRRWSRVAMTSVAVLVVTGTVAGVREVGGWSALTDSNYGRLLLAKLILFAALLAVASRARAWVQRHAGPAADPTAQGPPVRSLRASVFAEAGAGALVLAVTAVLVATSPASSTASSREQGARGQLPDGAVATVTADDTRLLSVRVQTSGRAPVQPVEVSAVASLPRLGVEGLRVQLHPSGETWAAHSDPLPFPGIWRVTVTVRTSDIDAGVTTVTLRVP